MTPIERVKFDLKADRKESQELYNIIIAMYSDMSLQLKQSSRNFLNAHIEHYKKHVKMLDKTLNKLNSQP